MTTDTVRLPRVRAGDRPVPKVRTIRLPALRLPALASFRQAVLTVGGFGSLTGAAWTQGLGWGLAAGGVSLLLLEWLSRPEPEERS